MLDDKRLKDELLSDDELDNVTGGLWSEVTGLESLRKFRTSRTSTSETQKNNASRRSDDRDITGGKDF